jgi:hypothetical protein
VSFGVLGVLRSLCAICRLRTALSRSVRSPCVLASLLEVALTVPGHFASFSHQRHTRHLLGTLSTFVSLFFSIFFIPFHVVGPDTARRQFQIISWSYIFLF